MLNMATHEEKGESTSPLGSACLRSRTKIVQNLCVPLQAQFQHLLASPMYCLNCV